MVEIMFNSLCSIVSRKSYSIVSHPEPCKMIHALTISPSQVQKNFSNILQMIGTPAKVSLARSIKSGRSLEEK